MALNRKYLGLSFPFTTQDDVGYFVDMEYDFYKEIKADIMHLIFTPKGQRLRMPDFGTNLIKFIFEQKDDKTLSDIKMEIQESMKKYIPMITITKLNVIDSSENNYTANVEMTYEINEGSIVTIDSININV